MTKPEHIPLEDWDEAVDIANNALCSFRDSLMHFNPDTMITEVASDIAGAILAERDRCAAIADRVKAERDRMAREDDRAQEIDALTAQAFIAKSIASRIRSGDEQMNRRHISDADTIEIHRFYWMWSVDAYGRPHFDIPVVEIAAAYGIACGRHVSDLLAEATTGGAFFKCVCGGSVNARNRDRFLAGEFRCVDCDTGWIGNWERGGKIGDWHRVDPEVVRRVETWPHRYQRINAFDKLAKRGRQPSPTVHGES